MATSIVDFLEELDTDSKLQEAYRSDPVGTAKNYGLSDEDVRLIEDKNWVEVARRFDDLKKTIRIISY